MAKKYHISEFKRIIIRHPNVNGGINSLSHSEELKKFRYLKDISPLFCKILSFSSYSDNSSRHINIMSDGKITI